MKNYFKSKIAWWAAIIYIIIGIILAFYTFNICTTGLNCTIYMAPIVFPSIFIFDSYFIFVANIVFWYTIGYIIDNIRNRK